LNTCPNRLLQNSGYIRNQSVEFGCSIYQTLNLRMVRSLHFTGDDYDVFNFVAIPEIDCEIPILSIDLVKLPTNAVVAIDFQPFGNSLNRLDSETTRDLNNLSLRSKSLFQATTIMKDKFEKYFSSFATFGKFSNTDDDDYWTQVLEILTEYVKLYAKVLSNIPTISTSNDDSQLIDYLNFRLEKDPAKYILSAAFGKDWTDAALKQSIFPLIDSQRRIVPKF